MTTPLPPNTGGSGFTSGFNPTPTYEQLQQTAATQVNKERIGLVPYTDNLLLTDMTPQNRQKDPYGYPANAPRLVPDHTLDTVFGPTNLQEPEDTSWTPNHDFLFSHLPPDMQDILNQEKDLPFTQRSPIFSVLSNQLQTVAKGLTTLDEASKPPPTGGTEDTAEHIILDTGKEALTHANNIGTQLTSSTTDYLQEIGPNTRNFDAINAAGNELQEQTGQINEIISNRAQNPSQADIAALNNAAKNLHSIHDEFQHNVYGTEMNILPDHAKTMAVVAEGNTLPNPLSYIGLHAATHGLLSADTQNGLNALTNTLFPNLSHAQQTNIAQHTIFAVMAGTGFSTQFADSTQGFAGKLPMPPSEFGYFSFIPLVAMLTPLSVGSIGDLLTAAHTPVVAAGHEWIHLISLYGLALLPFLFADDAPQGSDVDIKDLYLLNSTSALYMLIHSGLIRSYYKEIIASSGGSEQNIALATPILTEITHFLMMLAAARVHGNAPSAMAEYVMDNAERLSQALQAALTLTQNASPDVAIAVRQLNAHLNEQEYEQFVDIALKLLTGEYKIDSQGGEKEKWMKEFDDLRTYTTKAANSAMTGSHESRISNVITIV